MTYDIRVKGMKDLITISDSKKGAYLKQEWIKFKDGKRGDMVVDMKNWTGLLSDITAFRSASETDHSISTENAEKKNKEFQLEVDQFYKKTINEKALSALNVFRLVYWGFTGMYSENIMAGDRKIEDLAFEINKKFYKDNPNAFYPDIRIYKPVIKSRECNITVLKLFEGLIRPAWEVEKQKEKRSGGISYSVNGTI